MFRSSARLLIPTLMCAVVATAGAAAVTAADVLAQFKLGRPAAETYVFDAVWSQGLGYFGSGMRLFKALPPDARAAAVTAAARFAQAYTETDAFRARYAKQRDASRPKAPAPARSFQQQQAEQRAQFDKSVAEMKANAAKAAPDMRKMLEDMVASLQAQQAAMERDKATAGADGEGPRDDGRDDAAELSARGQGVRAAVSGARQSARGDAAARVPGAVSGRPGRGRAGRTRRQAAFVDRKFEEQSDFWKQLYRAGKPSVDAAREAATEWLAALEQNQTM